MFGGLKIPYHTSEVLIDIGKTFQVVGQIGTEYSEIGLTSPIDQNRVVYVMFFIILFHHLLGLLHIIGQQLDFLIFSQHFGGTESYTVHIDIDRTLHTPSTGLLHTPPILKRIADQQIGRDGSDGIVPIAHLHRIERHFNHRTVGSVFGHSNPVTYFQHIICRKLNAGHKSHDTVFKHQHQDGSRSTKPGEQYHRRFIYQYTDNNNSSNEK